MLEEEPLISIQNNDENQKRNLNFFQILGYGMYFMGYLTASIPLNVVILPSLVEQFVSNHNKVCKIASHHDSFLLTIRTKGKALGFLQMSGNLAQALIGPILGHISDVTTISK